MGRARRVSEGTHPERPKARTVRVHAHLATRPTPKPSPGASRSNATGATCGLGARRLLAKAGLASRLLLAGFLASAGPSLASPASASPAGAPAEPAISWQRWSPQVFERAAAEGRLVLLDLEAGWCHWCHVMDAETYGDPRVKALLGERFIAVRADQDADPALSARYEEFGWPATIVLGADGTERLKLRGFRSATELLGLLRGVLDAGQGGTAAATAAAPSGPPVGAVRLSAEARAQLLRRFLEGRPTNARPLGWPGRACRA